MQVALLALRIIMKPGEQELVMTLLTPLMQDFSTEVKFGPLALFLVNCYIIHVCHFGVASLKHCTQRLHYCTLSTYLARIIHSKCIAKIT